MPEDKPIPDPQEVKIRFLPPTSKGIALYFFPSKAKRLTPGFQGSCPLCERFGSPDQKLSGKEEEK